MMEIKSTSPLISQMVLSKLGMYCSERLSVDLYYLIEAINLVLPTLDQNQLKKEFDASFGSGEFDKSLRKIKKLNLLLIHSKTFYDSISDKSLVKRAGMIKNPNQIEEEVNKIFKRYWYRASSKISLMNSDLYNFFVFIISLSSVKNRTIPNEHFKSLEQKDNRTIKMDTRRSPDEKI